jgi:dihydroorotate dehydrogenase
LEFVAAGARHVALGTILFSDPDAPARVRAELAAELSARGYADVDDAYATAHANALSTTTT